MPFASFRPRWVLIAAILTVSSGCNYVHFGRIDRVPTDATLVASNSDLRMEKKLLQEELTIARKEGATLRAALDRPNPNAPGSEELAAKLNETSRQLAALRSDYAKLQAKRERLSGEQPSPNLVAAEQIADLKNQLGQTEEKLAASLRNFTQLQEDNQRLRSAIDQAHAENATLTSRVETITAQNVEVRSALAQLNTELLAQKESRAQAEQNVDALRTQLRAMADQSSAAPATSLAEARESAATGARAIEAPIQTSQASAAPLAAARLSVDAAKLRAAAASAAAAETPPTTPAQETKARMYVVRDGDTLEKIAAQFYGKPERWALLYSANNALLSGGRPLKAGMELEIPEQ
jgi:chromosome segregation ATPase/phage tail protein X